MNYEPLTLGWFLHQTDIDNLEYIGPEDKLNTPISGISVLDNPDGIRWIKKNEIILTTGYIFYDDFELQKQIIADLSAIDCTAFCIKVKRFYDKIPERLITEAAKYNLPLIAIPFYHGYSNIIKVVNEQLIDQSIIQKRFVLDEINLFNQLFIKKEGLMRMLEKISQYTQSSVLITSTSYVPVYYYVPSPILERLRDHDTPLNIHALNAQSGEKIDDIAEKRLFYYNHEKRYFINFLLPDEKHYLCIDISDSNLDDLHLEIVRQILTVISMALSSMQMNAHSLTQKNRYEAFFYMLADIRNKSVEEVQLICDTYGFNYKLKRICLSIECFQQDPRYFHDLFSTVQDYFKPFKQPYFLCHNDSHIVIYFFYQRGTSNVEVVSETKKIASQLYDSLLAYQKDLLMGMSRCHVSYDTIGKAYEESLQTLHLQAPSIVEKGVNYYDKQYAYHLLNQLSPDEIDKIYKDTVKSLVIYDIDNNAELLITLKAYLDNNLSIKDTAQDLFIHRNTLTSRLVLIKKMLHMSVDSIEEIFNLYLGICAYELLDSL